MGGSGFQKNKPQRCKNGIKNEKSEVKTFYFGDHIRTWTVISQGKVFTLCSNHSVRPAASTIFPNLALCVKSLPTPDLDYALTTWHRSWLLLLAMVVYIMLATELGTAVYIMHAA